ncbi:MAG: TlpA disulfide reductase family protein [Sphaerochaetaceae bacterium]|jgi:thiol-disulfide isomerase/thioredoxin|nr:TlpA disulfide reductase family protein [Sphaerochaetaceae bacterium]HHU88550.1 TlpA family protein disulfide reductase [Spirochaetales bacterium]
MNKRVSLIAVLLILVIATPLVAKTQSESLAPFWTIGLNMEEIDESIFAPYKLTLVNIWATFCPPCLQEMPALGELYRELADQGVGMIGIVTDVFDRNERVFQANLNTASIIVEKTKANYPHLLLSEDLYNLRLKNSQAVPETFFVDSRGKIVGETYFGAKNKAAWKKVIESTLKLVE